MAAASQEVSRHKLRLLLAGSSGAFGLLEAYLKASLRPVASHYMKQGLNIAASPPSGHCTGEGSNGTERKRQQQLQVRHSLLPNSLRN